MKRVLFLFVVLVFVMGCGGTEQEYTEYMEQVEDHNPEPVTQDCYSTNEHDINTFLGYVTEPPFYIWHSNPTIKMTEGITPELKSHIIKAVQTINPYLETQGIQLELDETKIPVTRNLIHLDNAITFDSYIDSNKLGFAGRAYSKKDSNGAIASGYIFIHPADYLSQFDSGRDTLCEEWRYWLVAHELLHTLGFLNHPPSQKYSRFAGVPWTVETIMINGIQGCHDPYYDLPEEEREGFQPSPTVMNQVGPVPSVLDLESLRYLYSGQDNYEACQ